MNLPTKAGIKRALNARGVQTNIIKNLLNMGSDIFSSLNAKQMAKAIKKLMPEAKRRIHEFGEELSPALGKFRRAGGEFTTANKTLNQLRTQFMNIKHFLDSVTSEKNKWDKIKEEIITRMNELGIRLDQGNFEQIWKAYDLLSELDKSVTHREYKYIVLHRIIELHEENKYDEHQIAIKVKKEYKQLYKDYMAGIEEEEEEEKEEGPGIHWENYDGYY